MNVQIRIMNENDAVEVAKISILSFSSPWSTESYIQEIKNPVALYLVAVINNNIVHPDFRKQKIGSLLLENLINTCEKQHNTSSFDLEVRANNIPAQKLYSKFGFKNNGIRKGYYTDNKEDAILMCR